jgi:putative transposase
MARKPREDVEGAIQHIYARGVRRSPLFRDEADRHRYLAMLGRTCRRYAWSCLSYCLMPNHVHLLIETPRANLGLGMSSFHGGYARRFNDRYGTKGHVFDARFGSTRMLSDTHLWTAVRYIVRNPVEAGLCGVPAEWRWSSHAALHRNTMPAWLSHLRLLELLSGAGGDPAERYAELVRI